MSALDRIAFGAPGVYTLEPEPIRRLTGVPMDVCAFVGVAPRGPCRVPVVDNTLQHSADWRMCDPLRPRARSTAVAVESFDEYRRLYGGFEGPGLLPYAVAAYFEQGGRRAWIVRIVHAFGNADDAVGVAATALNGVAGTPRLHARSEGAWGNALKARLAFATRPLRATAISTQQLQLNPADRLFPGTLLRLRLNDGSQVLRFVEAVDDVGEALRPRSRRIVTLEAASAAPIKSIEIVDAQVHLNDGAGGSESFSGLGLRVDHPRWIATVLCLESRLVWPAFAWAGHRLTPTDVVQLTGDHDSDAFTGGVDRYDRIDHEDFFDPGWDLRGDGPFAGIQSAANNEDITQIVVPDLYQPRPLPAQDDMQDPSLAGPEFALCVKAAVGFSVEENRIALPRLALDPADAGDLDAIIALQQRVADFVDETRDLIALFDVPPALKPQQVAAFRSHFDSACCAAYHPWLEVASSDDVRDGLIAIPPSAVAAGIIAARELAFGIPHGPANEIARQVVKPLVRVAPRDHDMLHPLGINVYVQEPFGIRLSAARTLSLDPAWRQLSVRRLLLMLRRTLLRQMQWAVFEPHTPALRRELVRMVTAFLRRLYRLGAFAGATEAEAFFVQCDDDLNPAYRVDNGQVVAHIGVAPSEPLEFIVVQFTRSGDGTLTLED